MQCKQAKEKLKREEESKEEVEGDVGIGQKEERSSRGKGRDSSGMSG